MPHSDPTPPSAPPSAPPPGGNRDTLLQVLAPLTGRRVADIGCGDGTWTRFLAQEGARAIGLEPNAAVLACARATTPAGDESYMEAGAEALPLPDASQDAVLFFNSLHHVPPDLMAAALAEAARVIRPDGPLVAFEPVARGANYDLNRIVDDEAEVRDLAHRALHAATHDGDVLSLEREFEYITHSRKRDFETWRDWQVAIGPDRVARFAAAEAAMRTHFEAITARCPRDADGMVLLDQPMRVTILRRGAP